MVLTCPWIRERWLPMSCEESKISEEIARRVLGWLIPGVVAGVPLLILPGVSFYFDITPKVVVLLLGTGIAALFWRGYGPGLEVALASHTGRWFVALIGAQAFSLVVSTVFSSQVPLSFAGTNWRRLGLVSHLGLLMFTLVLLGWLVADRARCVSLLRAVSVAGGVAAVYGIAQYFGIDPLLPASAYEAAIGDGSIVRPPGTLGHAGYFATYLLYALFLAGALARSDPSRLWRAVGGGVVVLCAAAIVLSGTRSAVLGLAMGGTVLLAWYRPIVTRRAVTIGVVAALALVAFFLSSAGEPLRNRVAWAEEDLSGGARLWLWRDSLAMALDYRALGAGPETFANTFPRFQSVELAQAYPDSYYESPHNVFLDVATAQGLPGLAVLLLLVAVPLVVARRSTPNQSVATGFAVASFVAGLVSQQFLVFTLSTTLAFYVGAVLLVAGSLIAEPVPIQSRYRTPARLGVLAVSVILLVFGGQLALADHALQQAREQVERRSVVGMLEAYERVRAVQPWGMNTDTWFVQAMDLLSRNSPDIPGRIVALQAVLGASLRAAESSDERPNALYGVAASHAAYGNQTGAEAALREAIRIAPRWYKPRWLLAQVLSERGFVDRAIREAELAVWLNGGKDPEVRMTLESLNPVR